MLYYTSGAMRNYVILHLYYIISFIAQSEMDYSNINKAIESANDFADVAKLVIYKYII